MITRIDLSTLEEAQAQTTTAFGAPDPSRSGLLVVGPLDGTQMFNEVNVDDDHPAKDLHYSAAEPPLDVPAVRGWGSCLITAICPQQNVPRQDIIAGILTLVEPHEVAVAQWLVLLGGVLLGVVTSVVISLMQLAASRRLRP